MLYIIFIFLPLSHEPNLRLFNVCRTQNFAVSNPKILRNSRCFRTDFSDNWVRQREWDGAACGVKLDADLTFWLRVLLTQGRDSTHFIFQDSVSTFMMSLYESSLHSVLEPQFVCPTGAVLAYILTTMGSPAVSVLVGFPVTQT